MKQLDSAVSISAFPTPAGAFRYMAVLEVREWHPLGEGRVLHRSEHFGQDSDEANEKAQKAGRDVLPKLQRR